MRYAGSICVCVSGSSEPPELSQTIFVAFVFFDPSSPVHHPTLSHQGASSPAAARVQGWQLVMGRRGCLVTMWVTTVVRVVVLEHVSSHHVLVLRGRRGLGGVVATSAHG